MNAELNATDEFYFQWHITERCNKHCRHCYQNGHPTKDLPLAKLELVLDHMGEALVKWDRQGSLSFTGGEPFVRQTELFSLMDRVDQIPVFAYYDILTNGSLISGDVTSALKNQRKLRRVQVSLEGSSPTINDAIRGDGSYQETLDAIREMKRRDLTVSVMTTISRFNYQDIPALIKVLNDEGVDCVHYRGRVDVDRMIEEQKAKLDPRTPHYQEMLKGLEDMRNMKTEVELWIGKEDYLIRQLRQDMEVPLEGTSRVTVKYYDFNEPITIEPPLDAYGELLPGWELAGNTSGETYFYTELNSEITGEDPAHSQISLSVTITNVGMEATAGNVRVEFRNSAVIGDNGEAGWINAEPLTSEPVNLEPGESAVYSASWGYDASHITKDELTKQLERTVIRIAYITPEGNEATRMYSAGGAPYPTAVPPEVPPD